MISRLFCGKLETSSYALGPTWGHVGPEFLHEIFASGLFHWRTDDIIAAVLLRPKRLGPFQAHFQIQRDVCVSRSGGLAEYVHDGM